MATRKKSGPRKVVILVKGGAVQSVLSNDPLLRVDLIDLDNEEFENRRAEAEEVARRMSDLIAHL